MEFKNFYFRVDDRLIHGQVNLGWIKPLSLKNVYVVDDLAYSDFLTCNLWQISLGSVELSIFSHDNFNQEIKKKSFNDSLLIVRDIENLKILLDSNPGVFNQIIIGGLHYETNTVELFPWFYISENNFLFLKQLHKDGIDITLRPTFFSKEIHFDEFFIDRYIEVFNDN